MLEVEVGVEKEGVVKWFNKKKGYGFIETIDGDYFAHWTNIEGEADEDGYKVLKIGSKVRFVVMKGNNGKLKAGSITEIE